MWKVLALVLVCLSTCCLVGCQSAEDSGPAASNEPDAKQSLATEGEAPSDVSSTTTPTEDVVTANTISLAQLDEQLSEFEGKVIVLDVWSTSCVPCMQEFHNLVELSQRSSDDLVCLSLNVDHIGLPKRPPESYMPAVEKFLSKEKAVKVRNYLASDADADVLEKFGLEAIPAILVYGKDGQLVSKLTDGNASGEGVTYEADVIPLVNKLLAAE